MPVTESEVVLLESPAVLAQLLLRWTASTFQKGDARASSRRQPALDRRHPAAGHPGGLGPGARRQHLFTRMSWRPSARPGCLNGLPRRQQQAVAVKRLGQESRIPIE